MLRNNTHHQLTEPLVVITTCKRDFFQAQSSKVYIVGGLHRIAAQRILMVEMQESTFARRKCSVYEDGLPFEAVLRLANMHNLCNSLTKPTAFIEHAEKCRQLLYRQFADKGALDDGQYMPRLPRYNHHSYIEWKQMCMAHIVGPGVVRMGNLNYWSGANLVGLRTFFRALHMQIK